MRKTRLGESVENTATQWRGLTKIGRMIALTVAGIGAAHFILSVTFWLLTIMSGAFGRMSWIQIAGQAASAFFLGLAFLFALMLAWRRVRLSAIMLILTCLISVACFLFDVSHHRYQIQEWNADNGCSHVYITWWWYDDNRMLK
jgi:hypothetical protein